MILALEYRDPLVKLFDLYVKIDIILFIFKYLRAHNFGLLSAQKFHFEFVANNSTIF
jgi:hypothetical protein